MATERLPIINAVPPQERYALDNEAQFRRQVVNWMNAMAAQVARLHERVPIATDATRGVPGIPGRRIFNTDDGNLNIDDGTNWILPDGTTT